MCVCERERVLILGEIGTSVELVLVRSNRRLVITARRGKVKQPPAAKTDNHVTRPHASLPFTQQVCVCVCVCVCVSLGRYCCIYYHTLCVCVCVQ